MAGRPQGAAGISSSAAPAGLLSARSWALRVVVAAVVLAAMCAFSSAAHAAGAVSGVNAQNGFPNWYQDAAGNRVAQCLDPNDAACIVLPGDFFDPTQPVVFPATAADCEATPVDPAKCNFPDEFFYALADSDRVPTPGCGALSAPGFAFTRLALEGAFGTTSGAPAPGQQIVFARTRIVVRGGLCPNTAYTFKTPFGDVPLTTDDTGGVKPAAGTTDVGCLAGGGPCTFSSPTTAPLFGTAANGGFLRSAPLPPGGVLGDAATPGPITGGTNGNAFAIVDGGGTVIGSTTNFTVQGKIAGPIETTPTLVDFAGVADGATSAPQPVALKNLGDFPSNGAITIGPAAVVSSGAVTSHPEEFSVSALPTACTNLARDASGCSISVTFHPPAGATGRRTARLQLASTGFRSPQFVDLTGNAIAAGAVATAAASPTTIDFGNVRIHETSPTRLVTVTNNGAAPLVVTDAVISGGNSQFAIASNTCATGTTVDPHGTCVIGLALAPFGAAGPVSADLVLTSNSQPATPAIHLTGTATGGIAAVSSTVSAFDGYPDWYMADDGVKVQQCIDPLDPFCIVIPDAGFNAPPPLHFLDTPDNINFPEEFFYQVSTSDNIALPGCNGSAPGRALMRSAIEGAFAGALPAPGDQIVFGRIRIVVRGGLCPNATYKFSHPYGQEILKTDSQGTIKPAAGTDDVGCLAAGLATGTVCDFTLALSSRVLGGLVRWDPAVPPAAPAGYLGDAVTLHSIVGAPYAPGGVPQNSFKIEHVGINPDTNLPEEIVDGETDQWTVMGKLLGPLVADNQSLAFGTVATGASRTQNLTLTNTGSSPLTINTLAIGGLDASEFSVAPTPCIVTLAANASCTVAVTFSPAAIGLRTAVLTVNHTGVNSPFQVDLSGVGSVGAATPNLTFSPRTLAFAPVHISRNSSIATMTVSNPGSGQPALTINDVRVIGDTGSTFHIVDNRCVGESAPGVPNGDPGSVPAGGSCQVDMVFASDNPGDFTAQIEVVTPDFPATGTPATPNPNTLASLSGTASAAVQAVSAAVDGQNGFPRWYQDENGVRIQPCLQLTNCVLLGDATFNPGLPVAFPTNFPGEFFYALADSDVVTVTQACGDGTTATGTVGLRLALEGSFVGGTPSAGNQITFGRMRILPPRGAGGGALCPDTPYRFVTPFGVLGPITTGPANGALPGRFRVNDATFDVGCGAAPCAFSDAFASPVTTSFVRWDPTVAPAAPAGFLGDAVSLHTITGGTFLSASGQPFNGFQVLSGTSVVGETNKFIVAGQLAGPLVADPTSVLFGHQTISTTSATQQVKILNVAPTSVTLGAAGPQLTGVNAVDFRIVADAGTTCTAGLVLASDASCTVTVAFAPGTTGAKTANLTVGSSTGQAATSVLSGVGDPALSPVVTLSPTSLGFGSVTVGTTSATQTLTVRNTGTAPLNVTAVTRNGSNAADFLLTTATATPCVGVSVAPGASCTVQVSFKPSATGLRSATLTLTHNPAGASQATSSTVPLSGTGTGSILSFNNNPVKFGTVNRGASNDQTVTVKNTGNAAAALSLASFSVTGTGYTVRSTTCGNLAVNNTCNVVVRFTAPNVVSTFNGTLTVSPSNGTAVTTSLTATTK